MDHDAQLLRRFTEEGSEAAFTELVRRHIDLVYGAALRRMGGDAHRAADVTQQVFIALARQAPQLARHTVLSAWLHSATRNLSINLMLAEQRRRVRETAAVALAANTTDAGAFASSDNIRPVLDAAIDELPEADRTAVVLRFLERRPFAEVGALLNVSADAARMRTDRALEKLRVAFARRGITSSAAALGALVSAQAGGAAPAGLAATILPAALAGVSGSAAAATVATTFLMSTKSILAATSVVAALGAGLFLGTQHFAQAPLPPLPPTPEHVRMIAALRKENLQLKAETDRLVAANVALQASASQAARATPVAAPPAPAALPPAPLPTVTLLNQQRAIMNNLRQLSAARDQFFLEYKRPPASIDELVGKTKYIRALTPAATENYALVALYDNKQPLTVIGPDGAPVTYDPTGRNTTDLGAAVRAANEDAKRILTERFGAEFVQRIQGSVQKAAAAYAAANNGKSPPNVTAALPYFATPQEGADFVEFSEAAKALGMKF